MDTEADVLNKLDKLHRKAEKRKQKMVKECSNPGILPGDLFSYLTPEEIQLRHELMQQLPTLGDVAEQAKERVRLRIAKRKQAREEKLAS
jgi:hypothetical protein